MSNPEQKSSPAGTLYVVATPIGNLEDITLRALRILREVDLIAAEDTRHTRKLLSHYDIHSPLISYHEHNRRMRIPQLISKLEAGSKIALVSDAGMPGISDPGHELIVAALEHNIEVTVAPGPSALLSALVVSGLPTQEFLFLGFPPRKAGERKRFIERALSSVSTVALFEAPNRIIALLQLINDVAPARRVVVARELTKKFEQVLRATAAELLAHFQESEPLGEFVVILEGSPKSLRASIPSEPQSPAELATQLMRQGFQKKEAMREAARRLNISRREVYEALLKQKEK